MTFTVCLVDAVISEGTDLEGLIADVLATWELPPGEDLVIWEGESKVAAVIQGTDQYRPRVVRMAQRGIPILGFIGKAA